jgi:hypothetical protein
MPAAIIAFFKALPALVSVLKELTSAVKSIPAINAHNDNEENKAERLKIVKQLEIENDIQKRRDLLRKFNSIN